MFGALQRQHTMGRLAFALWLFLTPVWILSSFYFFAHADNVGYDPSSAMVITEDIAFIPPRLVLIVLAFWLIIWLLKRLIFGIHFHAHR
jgi:hypothetical protein